LHLEETYLIANKIKAFPLEPLEDGKMGAGSRFGAATNLAISSGCDALREGEVLKRL